MTAEDVVYSFELIGSPESNNPRKFVLDWMESVEALDNNRVRITLKRPQPSLLHSASAGCLSDLSSMFGCRQPGSPR